MLPVTATPGSPFNPKRKHPITGKVQAHTGVDFPCPVGTEVRAPLPGRVDKTGFDPPRSQGGTGAGRYLRLDHGLIGGHRIQTRYYHLSAVLAPAGAVNAGQVVALTGNTGDSTGPHLHFEVRVDGLAVEPLAWLEQHTAAAPRAPTPQEDPVFVLIQAQRGHWLVAPGYAHQLTAEEWAESVGKLRDAEILRVHQFEDGPVGQRRFDLALAAYTQNALRPPAATVDVAALTQAVAAAIPAQTVGGVTLDQLTAAVRAAITGATITARP